MQQNTLFVLFYSHRRQKFASAKAKLWNKRQVTACLSGDIQ
ncbi:hypothetical protein EDWATA_02702 [Edwardsiella tarda ATCC 23685]|uniref:Uncharacterized protein n=1 Tax=Edwardsiella tarda ATCC 23685 TaxID=500638 RepID=D4F7G7_EDWTA|nr:hypothetical protein EDWATA_02702 [Edwardsiella tarda ATCC 23685]